MKPTLRQRAALLFASVWYWDRRFALQAVSSFDITAVQLLAVLAWLIPAAVVMLGQAPLAPRPLTEQEKLVWIRLFVQREELMRKLREIDSKIQYQHEQLKLSHNAQSCSLGGPAIAWQNCSATPTESKGERKTR